MKQLVAPLMGAAAKGAEEASPALRESAMGFMAAFTVRVRLRPELFCFDYLEMGSRMSDERLRVGYRRIASTRIRPPQVGQSENCPSSLQVSVVTLVMRSLATQQSWRSSDPSWTTHARRSCR